MQFVLKILRKHLANERKWLIYEDASAIDRQTAEGVRMAKERIPQLEDAIERCSDTAQLKRKIQKPKSKKQLNLFDLFKNS